MRISCRMGRRAALSLPLAGGPFLATAAVAQEAWPGKPVRMMVPYPPGGPTDILGRVAANRLTQDLGQPFVVENRGGAGGSIGAEMIARAAPDGYNFLVNASAHVIVPHMMRVNYDPVRDFAPVTTIASVPLMLVVPVSSPARDVQGLIAHLRATPTARSFASSSNGGAPHLAGEMFKLATGIELQHVPYRGSGQALPDVVAGQVGFMIDSMASSADLVRQGRLRALAVTTRDRQPAFPDLPTMEQAGLPGFVITTWYGIWAPAGTPARLVTAMQEATARALANPESGQRLAALGAIAGGESPETYADFTTAENARYARLVREANIRAE